MKFAKASWTAHSLACRALSAGAGAYAVVGGGIALLGWAVDVPRLAAWSGSNITMKANAAICAVAGGSALMLLALGASRRLVQVLGSMVCLIAGLTVIEHVGGVDLGIDTLLFDEPPGALATAAPGRMGPPASVSLTILGGALLLATGGRRARTLASGLGIVPIAIGALGIVGYLYGASQLYAVARYTGIALQTATMVAALGIGLIVAIPDHGMVEVIRRDDAGGVIFRRLLVAVVFLPLVIGWLRNVGERAGLYDMAFGTAIRTLLELVLLVGLLWWTANGVSRHARAARDADQALRDANRRKDEFLATLAHELRNPLAPLSHAVEILRRSTGDPTTLRTARATMERQLGHMVHLVDDLLDVSRISRGGLELRRERVDLRTVIEHAVETSSPVIDRFRHELVVTLPSAPLFVDGDLTRLTQVIGNLLTNAAKYTPPGGRIELQVDRDGGDLVVRVRDNGVGIPAQTLPRIFDIFTRGPVQPEGGQGGLGIGLALVKQIVELHGGRVFACSPPSVTSVDGTPARTGGSEFLVRLPSVALEPMPRPAEPSPSGAGFDGASPASLRVLIADDNVDAGDTLAMLLEGMGYQIGSAHDGGEALRVARALRPHVAFVDIGMPGLSGHDVCRRIRAEPWGANVVLVALTGWGQPEDRSRSAAAGFDHHLVKPAAFEAIEQILVTAAEHIVQRSA